MQNAIAFNVQEIACWSHGLGYKLLTGLSLLKTQFLLQEKESSYSIRRGCATVIFNVYGRADEVHLLGSALIWPLPKYLAATGRSSRSTRTLCPPACITASQAKTNSLADQLQMLVCVQHARESQAALSLCNSQCISLSVFLVQVGSFDRPCRRHLEWLTYGAIDLHDLAIKELLLLKTVIPPHDWVL